MLLNLPKILFIGGKGGVGKSTISSAIALHLSKQNKKNFTYINRSCTQFK